MIDYTQLTRRGQIRRLRRVAADALAAYGIAPVSLSLLNHSYHTTFALTTSAGERCVLHILRPVDADLPDQHRRIRIESELWWLDRVRLALNLVVPVPVRVPAGEGVVSIVLNDRAPTRLCTLFRWVEGRFVGNHLLPTHLEAVGRLTAQLHRHTTHLPVPDWFDRPVVDRADAVLEEETAALFTAHISPAAAQIIRRALQRTRQAQDHLGNEPGTFGLLHADIHQRNYLFDRGQVRLIDFGDCGWGYYLYDLAVTLSEIADSARYRDLRAALLAGYRQVRDLSAEHEAMIDVFILLRDVQNLAWSLIARDDPNYRDQAARIRQGIARLERQLDRLLPLF